MKKFHIPRNQYSGVILTWCFEHFGKPMPNGTRWDSYQHSIFDLGVNCLVNGRMFMFYNDIDAMAFKLMWM